MSIYIAHLLRNLNWLNNLDKKQKWSSRLQELLRKAVHWRNEKKLILHIYALMLALFALRWENNRKNCEEMEVKRLKLLHFQPMGLKQFTSKEATVKTIPTPTTPVHPQCCQDRPETNVPAEPPKK